jgi:hypothetical protein
VTAPLVEIRQAYRDAIVAGETPGRPWHEVFLPVELFDELVPELGEDEAHYGFAIGCPTSERQDSTRLQPVYRTILELRWARIIGAERQLTDYDAGLADEQALLAILEPLGLNRNATVKTISRRVEAITAGGLFLGRLTMSIVHHYPTT